MKVQTRIWKLRDYNYSQEQMFVDVNEFLTSLGPKKIISVSMSHEKQVVAWYWDENPGDSALREINMGVNNRVHCGIKTPQPLFINPTPPPQGTPMCKTN